MAESPYEAIFSDLLAQKKQIERLTGLLSDLSRANIEQSKTIKQLIDESNAFTAVFHIFTELVMSASPEIKKYVADATGQILSRSEATPNKHLRDLLTTLNEAATTPSRMTPEGRRAHFKTVTSEKNSDDET